MLVCNISHNQYEWMVRIRIYNSIKKLFQDRLIIKIILQTMFSLRNTTFCFISSSKHTFTGTNDDRTYSDREVLVWNFLFQHTLIVTQVFIANVINGCFQNYCFHNLRCAAYSRKIKISKIKENNILGHMNDVSCF